MALPEVLATGLALFLAGLFASAAMHKLRHPAAIGELAAQYLPGTMRYLWSDRLIVALAGVELLLAVGLLLPAARFAAALGVALMLLAYALLMGLQLLQGRKDLRCGCAGPASEVVVSPALVVRNLCTASLALMLLSASKPLIPSVTSLAMAIGIAVFLMLVYMSAEQMIANGQHMARST